MLATQIWMLPGPWTPTWTQVADLTLGILMAFGGNKSHIHQSPDLSYGYRDTDPAMTPGSSLSLEDTTAQMAAQAIHI